MTLPTIYEIRDLHRKYSPSDTVFDLVWGHCQAVLDIATQLLDGKHPGLDVDLVRVGCLLHDIGVYPLFGADGKLLPGVHYITHGTEGEKILIAEGFPETICRFASHHTGVGLTKQDVISQKLPLPPADYTAKTNEELLILYADKFHSKETPPCFNSYAWYEKHVSQFGDDKIIKLKKLATLFGTPKLEPLAKKYEQTIRV